MTETPTLYTYNVDAAHSGIRFWVRHLMISKVHGTIGGIAGTAIGHSDSPELTTIDMTFDLRTLSTGNEQRDGHIKSPDFLDVEKYPTGSFKSTGVRPTGGSTYEVTGDLTLHGVTKSVTLKTEVSDETPSPFGGFKVGVNATGVLDRTEYGVEFNQVLETGGVALGNEIHFEIDLELDRPA